MPREEKGPLTILGYPVRYVLIPHPAQPIAQADGGDDASHAERERIARLFDVPLRMIDGVRIGREE